MENNLLYRVSLLGNAGTGLAFTLCLADELAQETDCALPAKQSCVCSATWVYLVSLCHRLLLEVLPCWGTSAAAEMFGYSWMHTILPAVEQKSHRNPNENPGLSSLPLLSPRMSNPESVLTPKLGHSQTQGEIPSRNKLT